MGRHSDFSSSVVVVSIDPRLNFPRKYQQYGPSVPVFPTPIENENKSYTAGQTSRVINSLEKHHID